MDGLAKTDCVYCGADDLFVVLFSPVEVHYFCHCGNMFAVSLDEAALVTDV